MSAISMDGTSLESMDGVNPWEWSITMDYIEFDYPVIGRDIQSNPKKAKLTF